MGEPSSDPEDERVINVENPAELEQLAEDLDATSAEIIEAVQAGYTNRSSLELYFSSPDPR